MLLRKIHTSSRVWAADSHYDLLHIHHNATSKDIKSAFKKLSLKLHPDILKSQDLSERELNDLNSQYLKIKKSYEVLSDPNSKSAYDLKMGHGRSNAQASEFVRKMNSFHYSKATSGNPFESNDVPHFDSQKHYERNERMERRYRMNMADHGADIFGQNLYHRKMSGNGPKKGIYKEYKHNSNITKIDDSGRKMVLRLLLFGGFVTVIWYLINGTIETKKIQEEKELKRKLQQSMNVDGAMTTSTEGGMNSGVKKKALNVNNEYSKKLLQGAGVPIIKSSEIKEQFQIENDKYDKERDNETDEEQGNYKGNDEQEVKRVESIKA